MKLGKALLAAFILMAFPAVGFGQKETASKDGNGVRGLLLHDAANLQTRRWLDDGAGGALVSFSAGASSLADQGISGVSDADPWNVMIRSGAGTELGLAASPFAISIFDAASNLLGTTAFPLVVDLGANNDVTITSGTVTANAGTGTFNIQSTAALPGSVRQSDGTSFFKGAEDRILATNPFSFRQTDGTTFFKGAEDRILATNAASVRLADGTFFYKAMDQLTGDSINDNTATSTVFGGLGRVTVDTTVGGILLAAADPNRRITSIINMSNGVIFVGGIGVTTTNGWALAKGTVANDGNGGSIDYFHTAEIRAIVSGGTGDVFVQTESK